MTSWTKHACAAAVLTAVDCSAANWTQACSSPAARKELRLCCWQRWDWAQQLGPAHLRQLTAAALHQPWCSSLPACSGPAPNAASDPNAKIGGTPDDCSSMIACTVHPSVQTCSGLQVSVCCTAMIRNRPRLGFAMWVGRRAPARCSRTERTSRVQPPVAVWMPPPAPAAPLPAHQQSSWFIQGCK